MADRPKRRRRDERLADPSPMVLKERDIDVVEAVHRHRVLRQNQLQALFFGSQTRAQARLEKLYDHGFLERKFLPVARGEGRSPTLYVLDKRGAELLRTERGYDDITWYASSRDLKADFLEHTLAINDILVAVTLACRREEYVLETWQTETQLKAAYDYVSVRSERGHAQRVPVVPDSYFTIIARERRHPFFLELDRGTMQIKRFKTKVQAYREYFRGGGYEKRFGRKSLRVLTVTTGAVRLENLKKVTEEVGDARWFWFGLLSELGAETILSAPVWQQAGTEAKQALIG